MVINLSHWKTVKTGKKISQLPNFTVPLVESFLKNQNTWDLHNLMGNIWSLHFNRNLYGERNLHDNKREFTVLWWREIQRETTHPQPRPRSPQHRGEGKFTLERTKIAPKMSENYVKTKENCPSTDVQHIQKGSWPTHCINPKVAPKMRWRGRILISKWQFCTYLLHDCCAFLRKKTLISDSTLLCSRKISPFCNI